MTLLSRRAFLAFSGVTLAASTAGCLGGPTDVDDVTVYNGMSSEIAFSLTITRLADGAVVLDDAVSIAPGDSRRYADPIRRGGVHRIRYRIDGESPTTFLDEPYERDFEHSISGDESLGLYIDVRDDGVGFREGNAVPSESTA